jgi:hypothetical protein
MFRLRGNSDEGSFWGPNRTKLLTKSGPVRRESESLARDWARRAVAWRSRCSGQELSASAKGFKQAGKRRTRGTLTLGVGRKPDGRRQFRDPDQLPERNPLRNNTLFCNSRKCLRRKWLPSSSPFRCQNDRNPLRTPTRRVNSLPMLLQTLAFVERFVQTIGQESLDHFIGERHLNHLCDVFVDYYHRLRSHQGQDN